MELGLIVLASLALAVGLIIFLIVAEVWIERSQRCREGYVPLRTLYGNSWDLKRVPKRPDILLEEFTTDTREQPGLLAVTSRPTVASRPTVPSGPTLVRRLPVQSISPFIQIIQWFKGERPDPVSMRRKTPLNTVTALWIASESGHEGIVRLLLERGASIEPIDKDGRTPLFVAAEKGRETVVNLLLESGANVRATDKHGRTPQSLAVDNGHTGIVKLISDKVAVSTLVLVGSIAQSRRKRE